MDSYAIFTLVRDVLAELYPDENNTHVVVSNTGLDAKLISFSAHAQTNWHNILAEAVSTQQLDALLEVVRKDYSNNQALVTAYSQYRLFIDQGGHIEPPAQLLGTDVIFHHIQTNGGAAVSGNVEIDEGTFIGRDQYIQGDMVRNVYIQEAPKKRIQFTLERPPRSENFVGRKAEIDQLLADLQPGKVATLCGPGGIGKTAIAAEAVWQLAPGDKPPQHFPDGVLFHSFYNQPQAALAIEHIARSFAEDLQPNPKAAAQRALNGRCALLIFDGAEVADNLHLVLEIRNQCGVLVTSRQRKDAVEARQDVAPLPSTEAVALLQAWGGPRAANLRVTAQITNLVGRLPLAVRLVGRYLAQNEENAADYLDWLSKTPLAALNQGQRREESIPLLLARSLAQVSEQARQVLGVIGMMALAPFIWETIAAALSLSDGATRRALGELVNYGMVLRPAEIYEVTHALIHTYARLQLAPDIEIIHRLVNYYKQFVATNGAEFAQLNSMHPHFMTLLHICSERKIGAATMDLAWALDDYLDLQGYWTDRVTALKNALGAARDLQNRQNESDLLGVLGDAHNSLGQIEWASEYYEQALRIAQALGDWHGEGNHLGKLGHIYRIQGKIELAGEYYEQALWIAQELGNRHDEGIWLGNIGIVHHAQGQVEWAIEYFKQALQIAKIMSNRRAEGAWLGELGKAYRVQGKIGDAIEYHKSALQIAQEIGNRRSEGICFGNLGDAYRNLGQIEWAIAFYRGALHTAQVLGDRYNEETALGNLGKAYYDLGQGKPAIAYYEQARYIAQEIGNRRSEGIWLGELGDTYYHLGEIESAIVYYEQALHIAQTTDNQSAEGIWLGNIGNAYYALGEIDWAVAYYQGALQIAQSIGDQHSTGTWLGNLGVGYRSQGQVNRAIDCYQEALQIAEAIDDQYNAGTWLVNLGNVYGAQGQIEMARQYWEQALHIFRHIKSTRAEILSGWLEASMKE